MIRKLYPNDEELLDKYYNLHEQLQINKTVFRSTSHICNASIKKITNQSLNDSKMRTNMSFKSSIGFSRIMNSTKGFNQTGFSGFNLNANKTGHKFKLEPLKENKGFKFEKEKEASDGEGFDSMNNNNQNNNNNNNEDYYLEKEKQNNNISNDKGQIHNNQNQYNEEKQINENSMEESFFNEKNLNNEENKKENELRNEKENENENEEEKECEINSIKKEKEDVDTKNINEENIIKNIVNKNSRDTNLIKDIQQNNTLNNNNYNNNNLVQNHNQYCNKNNNPKSEIQKYQNQNHIQIQNQNQTNLINRDNLNEVYSFNNIFDEKVKKKIYEKDIEKKINVYKIKLNKDMLKILDEEKFKENQRNILYSKSTTEVERKRLENFIALERVISSEKIMRINE
jgi:hypothetical protein